VSAPGWSDARARAMPLAEWNDTAVSWQCWGGIGYCLRRANPRPARPRRRQASLVVEGRDERMGRVAESAGLRE